MGMGGLGVQHWGDPIIFSTYSNGFYLFIYFFRGHGPPKGLRGSALARIMVSFKENALMYSYISYVMNENNLSYSF